MKKKLLLVGSLILNLVLGIILLTNLYQKTPENVPADDIPLANITTNQDSLVPALKNVNRFMNVFDSAGKNNIVRAYTIAKVDMLQVLGISPMTVTSDFDSCRAYLGYDANSHFKLYLTPVKNNKDVFLNFKTRRGNAGAPDGSSYVMDLIAPCPNTCDNQSVLYKGSWHP